MELTLPYRISKACIRIPFVLSLDIANIVTNEMQEKLFHIKQGDIFEIKNLGKLKVESVYIEHDREAEIRFDYDFRFRRFSYTCKFI